MIAVATDARLFNGPVIVNDADPQNVFAFSGEAKSKKYAVEIIHECHEAWKKLVSAEGASKADAHSINT